MILSRMHELQTKATQCTQVSERYAIANE